MKQSTKYWIYALIVNPITTIVLYFMGISGFNMLNIIGVGIIGYGLFFYFVVQGFRIDMAARKAHKTAKGNKGKKKR